jgi:hypothetical protein
VPPRRRKPIVTPLPHGVMRIENGGIDLWSATAKAKMDGAFIEQLGARPDRHQLQSHCEVALMYRPRTE